VSSSRGAERFGRARLTPRRADDARSLTDTQRSSSRLSLALKLGLRVQVRDAVLWPNWDVERHAVVVVARTDTDADV